MLISKFAKLLLATLTEKEAEAILTRYLNDYGFNHFAFTYYSGHIKSGRQLRYDFVSKPLKVWHQHYLNQNYSDVDRTLEQNTHMTLPLFWDVKQQLAASKNKRERRIRLESIEFGIDLGLSIPIHGPNHDFASLTLHQFTKEECLNTIEEHQYEWLSATQIFYHQIKKLLDIKKGPNDAFKLSKREEQCLRLTAKCWRVKQIAETLKISERTVNFHLQNVNKKLGTNNKYQAIYKYFEFMDFLN